MLERAHHLQAPDDAALLFAAQCDEGRGDITYDERNLLAAQLQFPDGFDVVGQGAGATSLVASATAADRLRADYIWANPSGVTLMNGAL